MKIDDIVWTCLDGAVNRFNNSGDCQSLLCPRCENPVTKTDMAAAGERAIAYRLAFYLETELRRMNLVGDFGPLIVDCEYNRHLTGGKALAGDEEKIKKIVREARKRELEKEDDGYYVFSVAPDIVVHQRRTDANNLLVVEIKKASNTETKEYDNLKLELFTKSNDDGRGYGYKLGACVVAKDLELTKRELKIVKQFKDGVGKILAEP